jgi:hypothetical protein
LIKRNEIDESVSGVGFSSCLRVYNHYHTPITFVSTALLLSNSTIKMLIITLIRYKVRGRAQITELGRKTEKITDINMGVIR